MTDLDTAPREVLSRRAYEFHELVAKRASTSNLASEVLELDRVNKDVTYGQGGWSVFIDVEAPDVAWFRGGRDLAYSIQIDELGVLVRELLDQCPLVLSYYNVEKLPARTIEQIGHPLTDEEDRDD